MKLIVFPNFGNTCYINSVLQCIVNDSLFRKMVIEAKQEENDLLIEINKIVGFLNDSDSDSENIIGRFNLIPFINSFIKKNNNFTRFQEQDSHEFLLSFLDLFHKDVINNYYGQTSTDIKCTSCETIKNVIEDFSTINLSIPNSNIQGNTIHSLFNEYLKTETNDDSNNLYYCEKCTKNTVTEKGIRLWKLPKRLIIVLKRYSENEQKINNHVDYPINNLIIKESESGNILNYSLSGVIFHNGNLNSGHYVSAINTEKEQQWILIDDELVSQINDPKQLINQNAYILFYSC